MIARSLLRAREGSGGVVIVEGPAGVGKSGLLASARASAREGGMQVLEARGAALEREFAFGLVRQLFEEVVMAAGDAERQVLFAGAAGLAARLVGDVGPEAPAPPANAEFGSLHGLYWLTANLADRGPVLLAVDDAHLGDSSSLGFLGYLSRRLDGLPVLVVVAGRTPDPEASGLWRELADDPAAGGPGRVRRPLLVAGHRVDRRRGQHDHHAVPDQGQERDRLAQRPAGHAGAAAQQFGGIKVTQVNGKPDDEVEPPGDNDGRDPVDTDPPHPDPADEVRLLGDPPPGPDVEGPGPVLAAGGLDVVAVLAQAPVDLVHGLLARLDEADTRHAPPEPGGHPPAGPAEQVTVFLRPIPISVSTRSSSSNRQSKFLWPSPYGRRPKCFSRNCRAAGTSSTVRLTWLSFIDLRRVGYSLTVPCQFYPTIPPRGR